MKLLIEVFITELRRVMVERMISTMFDELTRRDIEMMILGMVAAIVIMSIIQV